MIAVAAVAVRRFIGPREVLQAAPLRMRVQFWLLVVSGIGIASVTVSARGEIVQQTNWIAYWPVFAAVVTWAFLAGGVLARLSGVKEDLSKEIAALKQRISTVEATAVRGDKLDDKLENINTKIDGLHEKIALLVGQKDWRDRLHGSKE